MPISRLTIVQDLGLTLRLVGPNEIYIYGVTFENYILSRSIKIFCVQE